MAQNNRALLGVGPGRRQGHPVAPQRCLASESLARKVITRRALQCSFSSVFHLAQTSMKPHEVEKATRLFKITVVGPMLVLGGAAGALLLAKSATRWT
uniref:Uncharacterized protein n=1 Tax=Rhizochromulina marina TaxID=1034831 RepID=A0A7S2RIE0_9STRA